MKSIKYFHINNVKFNYTLEFQSNQNIDYWKNNVPLIDYCESLGINIPHYCYHKSLSISGNCRMCLVEVKNSPKPVVSCAMSAKSCLNNSEIYTNSPLVKKSRENILEFLLLNHPLDCPICDQGGECDLQEQSFFFGMSKKRFYNFKRVVTDKNLGPIVKTVMTRCIHCTRCVRFAREIAGVSDLGMFGRGMSSEIGTYVKKTFQSELSGNVIDLCPVGALTSKRYPFASRSWELKNINSIDFSDGFAENLQVFLKNNKIVKITSGFDTIENGINWISDKTRFSFEGMFSPERSFEGFIIDGKKKCKVSLLWSTIFEEIVVTVYFQEHLSRHFYQTNNLLIVFNNNVSLEVLNLLMLFSNQYSFIKLRKSDGNLKENDFESNFLLNSLNDLNNSNLCLLIGVNSRYEASKLNLQLRKRYFKGNFKIISLGSMVDATIPVVSLGLNVKIIKDLAEGAGFLCQELLSSSNPTIIVGSEIYKRYDCSTLISILRILKKKLNKSMIGWNNLKFLSSSINEVGVNYLGQFKKVSQKDLKTSTGVYFLNSNPNFSVNLQKLINLKILNYFSSIISTPGFCFEHNHSKLSEVSEEFLNRFHIYNYINLPNNVFFESSGTYLNTQGLFKKTIKFLPSQKQTKEDWQIIRKLFLYIKKVKFVNNLKDNQSVIFNNTTFKTFNDYINLLYFSNSKTKSTLNCQISGKFDILKNGMKCSKKKLFLTNTKNWLKDFYIGGTDSYSKYSSTMINCSKNYRSEKNNFFD